MNEAHIRWDRRVAKSNPRLDPLWFVAMRVAEAASIRADAQQHGLSARAMFAIYIFLLILSAGSTAFSLVQWERKNDAEAAARGVKTQYLRLEGVVAERGGEQDDLLQLAELAVVGNAQQMLARLRLLEDERPDLARNAVFQRLRRTVLDLATTGQLGDASTQTARGN